MTTTRRLSWIEAHMADLTPNSQRVMQLVSVILAQRGCKCDPDIDPLPGRLVFYHDSRCKLAGVGESVLPLDEITKGGIN